MQLSPEPSYNALRKRHPRGVSIDRMFPFLDCRHLGQTATFQVSYNVNLLHITIPCQWQEISLHRVTCTEQKWESASQEIGQAGRAFRPFSPWAHWLRMPLAVRSTQLSNSPASFLSVSRVRQPQQHEEGSNCARTVRHHSPLFWSAYFGHQRPASPIIIVRLLD